jgi:hypothetical protein
MASKPVTLEFNAENEELWIIFGSGKSVEDNLIIDGFLKDSTGHEHTKTLSIYAQEKIIKALVANMELR